MNAQPDSLASSPAAAPGIRAPRPPQRHALTSAPRTTPSLATCLPLLLLCLLPACAQQEDALEKFPSLDEVRSRHADQREDEASPPELPSPQARLRIYEFTFPINHSIESAWSHIDHEAIPRQTRQAWRDNGIRLGLLDGSNLNDFREALPQSLNARQARLFAADQPTPLQKSPPLREPVRVQMPANAGGEEDLQAEDGRIALLTRARSDGAGQRFIHLIPQHHKREVSLEPRNPLEKELDGRLFNELAVRLPAPRDKFLVLALHRPWPEPPDERRQQDSQAKSQPPSGAQSPTDSTGAQPAGNDGSPRIVDLDPVPPHMGRALFAARRLGQPVQTLLLISVSDFAR